MPAEASVQVVVVDWDGPRGEDARRVRFAVFVDEQCVPSNEEIDSIDPQAWHLVAYGDEGRALGTGRMFPDPDNPVEIRIGRMAVIRDARGIGVGAALMRRFLQEARFQGFRRAVLSAQTHAIPFYERFGFRSEGDDYLDAGIPHRTMRAVLDEGGRSE